MLPNREAEAQQICTHPILALNRHALCPAEFAARHDEAHHDDLVIRVRVEPANDAAATKSTSK